MKKHKNHRNSAVEFLLKKGANANIVLPRVGIAPFHLIIGSNNEDFAKTVVKLILQHGGNPNIQSDDGLTPLHIAVAWGHYEITELLLHCGGNPFIQDRNGFTALDYSVEYKHLNITQLLNNFMPNNIILSFEEEQSLAYDITLDKIVINNGYAIGEYKTAEKTLAAHEFQSSGDILDDLPEYKPSEFLDVWFEEHICKLSLSSESSTKRDHFSSGSTFSDESDKLISIGHLINNVNFRTRNKLNDKQNTTAIVSSKQITTRKKIYERDDFCKFDENTRESGIATLPNHSLEYTENSINHSDNFNGDRSNFISCLTQDSVKIAKDKNNDSGNEIFQNEKVNDDRIFSVPNINQSEIQRKIPGKNASSDYFSCNDISSNINSFEKNIFEITSDLSNNCSHPRCSDVQISNFSMEITNLDKNYITNVPCQVSESVILEPEESFVSVSEVYKYTDKEDGIVLYEKRLKGNSIRGSSESEKSMAATHSSKLSSLPASIDYDSDRLRKELQCSGFNPGPITATTKRLYLRKLLRLKKEQSQLISSFEGKDKVFSSELEKTLRSENWSQDLTSYKLLDASVSDQFSCTDHKRTWREGHNKSSFTYLLLDPRLTNNLPCRSETLSPQEIWRSFLSSIFYVGKGKRSRPYSHLYEAAHQWNLGNYISKNKKIQRIIDIWKANRGVVCLHLFQNVIPVEAYTREAAMISALGLSNLENNKGGEFYGVAATWSTQKKEMYGVFLLHKALSIFLHEGERQLSPKDID
ncbi:uncharacterized protein LOC108735333 isoform X1 [Agrilus planipennis]|uniref:Uncharacterized protein LOC108735333 isoform X1 n=1 Tax=Agrilus planipennis TaxID=224129 RepID=A0A7F5RNM1_AGRPL|nr:uncharacterized protein LOC108735333 isoform X1 [Agrilus planipennis]